MDLPTYTNIWRIEKRLYKLYDLRLPMPLPLGQIAAFAGITVPYILLLTLIGIPFNHNLFWLYVLPPWALTWLATRPVLENKRLPELLGSQVRYLGEPSVWCRMAPAMEKDEIVVSGRVWHASRQPAPQAAVVESRQRAPVPARAGGQPKWAAPAPAGPRRRTEPRHRRPAAPQSQPVMTAVGQVTVPNGQAAAGFVQQRARGGRAPILDSRVVPRETWPPERAAAAAVRPPRRAPRPVPPSAAGDQQSGWATRARPGGTGNWPAEAPRPRVIEVAHAESGKPAGRRAPRPSGDPLQPVSGAVHAENSRPAAGGAAGPVQQTVAAAHAAPGPQAARVAPKPVGGPVRPATGVTHTGEDRPATGSAPGPVSGPLQPAAGVARAENGQSAGQGGPRPATGPLQPPTKAAGPVSQLPPAGAPAPVSQLPPAGAPAPVSQLPPAGAPAPVSQLPPAGTQVGASRGQPGDQGRDVGRRTPLVTVAHGPGEERPARAVEQVLSGPAGPRGRSWHDRVTLVSGGHGPGRPRVGDQEERDKARARMPLPGPRRIVVLGCTSGAGQTVTALLTARLLASLRAEPVGALDLNPGSGSLTQRAQSAPAATVHELLSAVIPAGQAHRPAPGLEVIGADPAPVKGLDDRDFVRIGECLAARYGISLVDPGASAVGRVLAIADQLVLVAPASGDAPRAVSMTREWLEAHDHRVLAANAVMVVNGVSGRSMADVEQAEAIMRGRCRAIVRVPWEEQLGQDGGPCAGSAPLRLQVRQALTALAGVLVSGPVAGREEAR